MSNWGSLRDWHRDPAFWRDLYLRTVSGLFVAGVVLGVAGITELIPRRSALFAGAIVAFGVPLVRVCWYMVRVARVQVHHAFNGGSKPVLIALIAAVETVALVLSLALAGFASYRGGGPTTTLLILLGGMFIPLVATVISLEIRRARDAAY